MSTMNQNAFLLLAVALAGCASPSYEVVRMRDGVLRASTSVEAAAYCKKDGSTLKMIGKAPAETGVLFRCDP